MSAFVGTLLANGAVNLIKKVGYFAFVVFIFAFLISVFVLPYISLPTQLVEFFKSEQIYNLYMDLEYFMPIGDMLICLSVGITLKLALFLWNIVNKFGEIFSRGAE